MKGTGQDDLPPLDIDGRRELIKDVKAL